MVEQTQVIVLRGLEGNELISTGYVQNLLQPYVSGIIALLWVIWFSILIFMIIYNVRLALKKENVSSKLQSANVL